MSSIRAGFLVLVAAAPLSASAASPAKDAAPVCAAPAPRPLLKKAFYADYAFEPGPENSSSEEASSGTVHLVIQSAGCRDGFEHSFTFVDGAPDAAFDDRDRWLAFATEQLKALKTFRRARADVKDLLTFLAGAKSAVTRGDKSELRLEVCRDGSPPSDDGCSLKSGGGYRFAVRALDKGRVQVFVSRYRAL